MAVIVKVPLFVLLSKAGAVSLFWPYSVESAPTAWAATFVRTTGAVLAVLMLPLTVAVPSPLGVTVMPDKVKPAPWTEFRIHHFLPSYVHPLQSS